VNKALFLILIFFFFNNCTSTKKLGFWKNNEKNQNNKKNIKQILITDKKKLTEFNPQLKLNLNIINIENKTFDNKNNIGSQNYTGLLDKVGSYNYSKLDDIDQLNFKPAFLNDELIFFDKKGSITKYDNSQKIIWKNNHYSKVEIKLKPKLYFAIDNENLLVVDSISKYYSVNINTGNLNWMKSNTYPFNSEIRKHKDKIFVVDYKNTLRCYNIKDGTECWNLQTDNSFTISNSKNSLIIINESVIFNNSLGDITAVDIKTGLISWQLPTQNSNIINETYNFKISKLVSDGKSIFFSNNKNEFYSVDFQTGITNWVNKINSNITPIIINNLIFTISNEGYLFTIEKNTGNIIRINDVYKNYKIKKRKKITPVGFVVAKNKMYLTSNNGIMTIIDLNVGNIINNKKISSQYISEPFIYNEHLYVIKKGSIIKFN
jgi:outer membrane protein assembly factor BamB